MIVRTGYTRNGDRSSEHELLDHWVVYSNSLGSIISRLIVQIPVNGNKGSIIGFRSSRDKCVIFLEGQLFHCSYIRYTKGSEFLGKFLMYFNQYEFRVLSNGNLYNVME